MRGNSSCRKHNIHSRQPPEQHNQSRRFAPQRITTVVYNTSQHQRNSTLPAPQRTATHRNDCLQRITPKTPTQLNTNGTTTHHKYNRNTNSVQKVSKRTNLGLYICMQLEYLLDAYVTSSAKKDLIAEQIP